MVGCHQCREWNNRLLYEHLILYLQMFFPFFFSGGISISIGGGVGGIGIGGIQRTVLCVVLIQGTELPHIQTNTIERRAGG